MNVNAMTPMLRELADARTNRDRADVLLRCPDNVMLKYSEVMIAACQRADFHPGACFIAMRVSALRAVRSRHGLLPEPLARQLEAWRIAMSEYAAGLETERPAEKPPAPPAPWFWPLDAKQRSGEIDRSEPAGFRRAPADSS